MVEYSIQFKISFVAIFDFITRSFGYFYDDIESFCIYVGIGCKVCYEVHDRMVLIESKESDSTDLIHYFKIKSTCSRVAKHYIY